MPTLVSLLRGINVGGKAMIPMAALRELFAAEGLADAKTLLQSGNVIFRAKSGKPAAIEKKLETALKKKAGRDIGVHVRDAAAWKRIVAANPFPKEAAQDPSHLVVMCLKAALNADAVTALIAAIVGREIIRAGKDSLYIYYPDGIGESKLTNALIERKLGTSGTARNWNTVRKIAAAL